MATKQAEIRDLIVTKLEAIQDADSNDIFVEVARYPHGDFSGYPSATVRIAGSSGKVIDTHRNERTFVFEVALYQEQSEQAKNADEANEAMLEAVDAVIEAFDQDKDLGGQVEIVRVVDYTANFVSKPGTLNFANFSIEAVAVLPNY
jgi:hypothetical protein